MSGMQVQVIGTAKSKATRKAERFFKERRVPFHFMDLRKRAPTPGELRKWVQRYGVEGVLDPESKAYQENGLQFVSASTDDWLERMAALPEALRLPLVRGGGELTVGEDPNGWTRIAQSVGPA